MGITGSSDNVALDSGLHHTIARVREHAAAPLAVGFGVANRKHFDDVDSAGADGVVVGSKFVEVIMAGSREGIAQRVKDYCLTLSQPNAEPRRPKLKGDASSAPFTRHDNLDKNKAPLPSRFGQFGGAFVPESIYDALVELEHAHQAAMADPKFMEEFRSLYGYMGRPSNLYYADRLTQEVGGAKIWLKREDL
jgi:tryptophan synthase